MTGGRGTTGLIVGAGIVSAFQVGKAPLALDAVRADLELSLAVAGWLLSAFAIVGAVAGMAIGLAAGRAGMRRLAVGGLLLQALGSAIGGGAGGAPLLLASRAVEGLGFLAVIVAAPALLAAITPAPRAGRVFALWSTFMPVGMTIILVAAPLLPVLGWRGLWLANAALLAGYALVVALRTKGLSLPPPAEHIGEDARDTLSRRGPWLLAGLFTVFCTAFFAAFGFLPTILGERLAVSPPAASLLTALAILASAGGNLFCGRLIARGWSGRGLLGIGIFTPSMPAAGAYVSCLMFSAISGLIPVVLFDAAPHHAPRPDRAAASMGLLMQGNNLGLLVGPAAAGLLAGSLGWPSLAALVAVVALAGIALAAMLPPRRADVSAAAKPSAAPS
jgi:DHA1 family inner membrane transport protein